MGGYFPLNGETMSTEAQIDEKIKINLQPPKLWKVIIHNDDKTPMEFVIELLTSIFKHNEQTARDVTMEIHNTGSAVAGIYSHEIAEQRGIEATHVARSNNFPLMITIEQEE
jgi:ATP-dependent Clp protease adaptor protein ClpS